MRRSILCLGICMAFVPQASLGQTAAPMTYETIQENFPNPERGWYIQHTTSNPGAYASIRSGGHTLLRRYFRIDEFRAQPLPQSFLSGMSSDLEAVRRAGLKVIPRFTYNFSQGDPDAPLDRILAHIDQVRPILQANSDIIAFLEAGFIGAWGEWHHSTHGLDANLEAKKKVMAKLLEAMPPDRMVALRYPRDKGRIFGNFKPLSPQEAFTGTPRARTGHHNDCFLASDTDEGTYDWVGNPEEEKEYLNLDSRFVVQGGETCKPSNRSNCQIALKELQQMRWNNINLEFHAEVINAWKSGGCFETVSKNLGYRFRLVKSIIQDKVKPGSSLKLEIHLINEGWGNLYNSRQAEIILRRKSGGKLYYLSLRQDPRLWQAGVATALRIEAGIPADMPTGAYDVFINLPDPHPKLVDLKAYSIRLANRNTWEEATGFNSLLKTVEVDKDAAGAAYTGGDTFRDTRTILPASTASRVLDPVTSWVEGRLRGGSGLAVTLEKAGRLGIRVQDMRGRIHFQGSEAWMEKGLHAVSLPANLPAGAYRIELSLDGVYAASLRVPFLNAP